MRDAMHDSTHGLLAALFGTGVLVGIGQLLLGKEPITLRRALGRAIVTGGLSTGAAAVLVWFPAVPLVAVVGLGAALASLGTSGLERILQRYASK
jgi:hypothetical protein